MVSYAQMGECLKTGAITALGAALFITACGPLNAQSSPVPAVTAALGTDDERLMGLFRDDARREDALDPMAVIYRGGTPSPTAFRQMFTDAQLHAQRGSVNESIAALRRIDRRRLSDERRISYDVFLLDKRQELGGLQPDMAALTAVRPFNHFGGLHIEFPSLVARDGALKYDDAVAYRANLELMRGFAVVLDNAVARFRQGLGSGVVETRLTTNNMIGQIDTLLAQPVDQSPFTSPVRDFPPGISPAERAELRAAYAAALRDEVLPAYRRLRAFLHDEYLPAARERIGIAAMRGGTDFYRRAIRQHTTLSLDPQRVHQLGLDEVARIQGDMDGVRRELGYDGDLKTFFNTIRTDPRFHPKTREQLAAGFAAVARKVDAVVPQYFNRTPRTKLLIEPYPAYREKYEAGGSYNQGSPDGSRPGVFYYNAYDLPSRFLSGITTLYLHEGAPGHHFQISLAQEDRTLPDFQRFGGNNAYVEGWALYAETLGYPMGFYKDPLQHWGTLDDEMLRAMRLVVDTGIHAKGWSRERAIAYMLANSGMGESDATAEVERYIAWPGQALSYKIGALTIQRLRKKAEAALGARFDVRDFHDQILGSGALPLPILEAKIDRWIARTRAA
ncbi:DUF885 family protein [Novosphingobium sp.]|uniref:DUF885 domain-containing protein n=1 Tax=Novosphingobium sp. TaxID=1874826 RepID=UPI0025D61048|nr:DUF885 domain-containing protein [Novosphingobium sp.]